MAPPDKLPESTTAAPAAPIAPTEGGVIPDAAAKEILGKAGEAQSARVELAETAAPKPAVAPTASTETTTPSGTPAGAPPAVPGTTTQEKPKTGWAGFVSSLSAGWGKISEWFGDVGKKIGDWIKDLMGIKGDAGDKAKQAAEGLVGKAKEAVYKLTELLNPTAPIFTFLSGKTPRITSNFGHRDDPMAPGHGQDHKGVDVTLAPGDEDIGEPIVATRTLKVVDAGTSEGGGNSVTVEDPANPGITYTFRHLESLNRAEGEVIQPGEMIAKIGNTGGRKTGAHLHLEAKKDGGFIDPAPHMGLA